MAKTAKITRSILIVLTLACFLRPTTVWGTLNYPRLVERVLDSLESALDFYELDHKTINLDGIYGLRVAEGSLKKILEDHESGKLHINTDHLKIIKTLHHKATSISKEALPFLQDNNPEYFERFKKQVAYPWKEFKPYRQLDTTLFIPWNKREQISFDEQTSDRCMSEMTGTGGVSKPCQLSARCWQLMTAKGAGGYTLTHQGLFLLLGETQGCTNEINTRLKKSNNGLTLQKVYDRICASMYPQMVELEKPGPSVTGVDRDLYMEQAMVCAMMGFKQFLSKKRLEMVLSWQRRNGCFNSEDGKDDRDVYEAYSRKLDTKESRVDNSHRLDSVKRSADIQAGARKLLGMRTMRSLLVEKELENGCMSHVTGVATALLGVYVRWLLSEETFPKQSPSSPINGTSLENITDDITGSQTAHFQHRHIMGQGGKLLAVAENNSIVLPQYRATALAVFVLLSVMAAILFLATRKIIKNFPQMFRYKKQEHVI